MISNHLGLVTFRWAVEDFGRRPFGGRAAPIFRDEANLDATPDLWASIVQALDESAHLILLASPESAERRWVIREVGHFAERKGFRGGYEAEAPHELARAISRGGVPVEKPDA